MSNRNSSQKASIRIAKTADHLAIRRWLQAESEAGIEGSFWCNERVIASAHAAGKLLVYIDAISREPVGFQVGGLITPGILQIRDGYRRQGIGRKLVRRCIQDAIKRREFLLSIQCKPPSSIPFWEEMGFTLLNEEWAPHAYQSLQQKFQLPAGAPTSDIVIRFFAVDDRWSQPARPSAEFSVRGYRSDEWMQMDQRVSFHEVAHVNSGDVYVEIVVDGQQLYFDKGKYREAMDRGIERCLNGFYIEQIKMVRA